MTNTLEDVKQNKVENMHDVDNAVSVDETEGGMTREAFAEKREAVASVEKQLSEMGVATEHSLPKEKQGFFSKLKESFKNMSKVSPEKMIAKLQSELAEDLRELNISKTYGSGSTLGGFSGKSSYEKTAEKYGVSQSVQNEYKTAIEELSMIPQTKENNTNRVSAQKKVNSIKAKIAKEMQVNTETKVRELQSGKQ